MIEDWEKAPENGTDGKDTGAWTISQCYHGVSTHLLTLAAWCPAGKMCQEYLTWRLKELGSSWSRGRVLLRSRGLSEERPGNLGPALGSDEVGSGNLRSSASHQGRKKGRSPEHTLHCSAPCAILLCSTFVEGGQEAKVWEEELTERSTGKEYHCLQRSGHNGGGSPRHLRRRGPEKERRKLLWSATDLSNRTSAVMEMFSTCAIQ